MNKPNDYIYNYSFIELKDKKCLYKSFNSTFDTMYQIGSISKFITSLIVAKFYEIGIIDYDTDINNYLKKWKCPYNNITLRHLLTHTSGSLDYNGYFGLDYQKICKISNIDIINGKFNYRPFSINKNEIGKFHYSGSGFQVIQEILEEITGKHLYKLIDEYIFKPLNLKNSTGKLLYKNQNKFKLACNKKQKFRMYPETASAGIWMSSLDLLLLVNDFMNGYNNNNSKILKQSTIKLITTDYKYNRGLGMSVEYKNGNIIISHTGNTYGYSSIFICKPNSNYINILLIYHDNSTIDYSKLLNINKELIGEF